MDNCSRGTIIFVGNSGVGKSYLCNRIFELCRTSTRFESSSSISSVTENIQCGRITHRQQLFDVVDTPGFSDTNDDKRTDGENFCNLIKALESYNKICGIVFVYTDRFTVPHLIWLERIIQLISESSFGYILLLHNKSGKLTDRAIAKNEHTNQKLVKRQVSYFPFELDGSDESVMEFLENQTNKVPVAVTINQIPDMCYERTEQGAEYEQMISETYSDRGDCEWIKKDTSHWEIDMEIRQIQVTLDILNSLTVITALFVGGPIGLSIAIGLPVVYAIFQKANGTHRKWVTSQANEYKFVEKRYTEIVYGTYKNDYNVRYDGSKDKTSTVLLRTRKHQVLQSHT